MTTHASRDERTSVEEQAAPRPDYGEDLPGFGLCSRCGNHHKLSGGCP